VWNFKVVKKICAPRSELVQGCTKFPEI